ncbi:MAG: hypothetical protein H8K08_13905 [Nitrospira sp.]|nr:hypothetical protein [Nitrospira sp.]
MSAPLTACQIWRMPVLLAFSSVAGLTAALLDDGIGDIVSVAALGMPVVVIAWFVIGRFKGVSDL